MSLRIFVIHNPVAGRRYRRRLRTFLRLLDEKGYEVLVRPTTHRGDAREAARTGEDVDVIIVAGGDGTVNEVVDGLCARGDDDRLPMVGFLPLGTANVLAWELGLPRDPAGLVKMIERRRVLRVRMGIANDRRFILMASVGFDARAVSGVNDKAKRLLGGAAYVMAALKAVRGAPPLYTVWAGGRERSARTVIVTRARRYGGPFVIAPDAGLDTSDLNVVMLHSYGFMATLKYGLALAMGRLHSLPDVEITTESSVRIDGPAGEPVQMDGDITMTLPVSITMDSRTVPILAPEEYLSASDPNFQA